MRVARRSGPRMTMSVSTRTPASVISGMTGGNSAGKGDAGTVQDQRQQPLVDQPAEQDSERPADGGQATASALKTHRMWRALAPTQRRMPTSRVRSMTPMLGH